MPHIQAASDEQPQLEDSDDEWENGLATEDAEVDDNDDDGGIICLPWWPETLDIPAPQAQGTVTAITSTMTGVGAEAEKSAYHVAARLPDDREGLLIDTGAFDNLTGSAWVSRIAAAAQRRGRRIRTTRMNQAMEVLGVGKPAHEVAEEIHAPGRLENGADTFRTPVVPEGDIPALLGIRSLEGFEAIIDCRRNRRRMYLGSETVVQAVDSTTTLQMYPAISEHLMLPITNCETAKRNRNSSARTEPLHLLKTEPTATASQPLQPAADDNPSNASNAQLAQGTTGDTAKRVQFQ